MGLCFCYRSSVGFSPGDDDSHPLPRSLTALPAAPRPARLARPTMTGLSVPPKTPPPRAHLHSHSRQKSDANADATADGELSPRQGSSTHVPIPKIPDFEGLADSETDSDDELLSRARMRAAGATASPVPSVPVTMSAPNGGDLDSGTDNTNMSPLSSLMNRIGTIGRSSPTRPVRHSRMLNTSCSTDELAAAARRAEVRRLTQRMIQEELQIEQMQQQQHFHQQQQHLMMQQQAQYNARNYKRSSMSTIKEDPSDVSLHSMTHPHNTVAIMDGSGYRTSLEYTFTRSREDLTVPPAFTGKGKEKSTYVLPKPPALPAPVSSRHPSAQSGKIGLPHSISSRSQTRASLKDNQGSIWASFATDAQTTRPLSDNVSQSAPDSSVLAPPENTENAVSSTTAKTESSSTQEVESGQNSLRIKHLPSNGLIQNTKKDGMQDPTTGHAQTLSDSLTSMDEEGSVHEAREARVVVNRKKNGRKASGSSHISSFDLPPPLVNEVPSSDGNAIVNVESTGSDEAGTTDTHSLPARNATIRLPFLSLDRFTFGLRKSSSPVLHNPGSLGTNHVQKASSTTSLSLRNTTSGKAPSMASTGNQLDGQVKNKSGHDDGDTASAKSQYHSMSSVTLKKWAKENPRTQCDLASPQATTTDVEKMAEEWHQQIQKLDHSSPARADDTNNAGPQGATSSTQRRSISHTYPLSSHKSGHRDMPQRGSARDPWSNSPDTGLRRPITLDGSKDGDFKLPSGIRRHTLSIDGQGPSDSWRTEPSWKKLEKTPRDHSSTSERAMKPAEDEELSNVKDIVTSLSPLASQATVVHNEAPSDEPESSYTKALSTAIRAGIKKVIYRKQVSTPSLTALAPSAAASSRSLNQPCSVTANQSKASSLKVEKSAPASPLSQVATPISEANTSDLAPKSPVSPRSVDESLVQDIDGIFGVLVSMESNQRTAPVTPSKSVHSKVEDGDAHPENEFASPQTIPSTPIASAYADVRAYISGVLPGSRAGRLENSPSSSYQEAASHQDSDSIRATTQADAQITVQRSLDTISVKSDSVPSKRAQESGSASAKYMTWNGRTKPSEPLLKSTVQFNAELENIFLGKKENRKTFSDRTLQPALKQN